MPTYEYQCNDCQHAFEAFHSITANPLTDCPECKKPSLRRLIGAGAGLIFKGSGFYCTDYKSSGYKQDESVDRHKKASKDVKESTSSSNASGGSSSPSPSTGGSSTPPSGSTT
ncbi:MAG: FmdB family zinc ribbon protein [Planctomycetota bacterium]